MTHFQASPEIVSRLSGAPARATDEIVFDPVPAGRVDLSEFYDREVLPRLTADLVYTSPAHNWKRSDGKWRGACPWHRSESGSSFNVSLDSGAWYCAGCGVGGGPIQYRYRLQGGSGSPKGREYVGILRELADLAGVAFPERELTDAERKAAETKALKRAALEHVYRRCQDELWSPAGEAARAYLAARGINADAARDLELGLYPDVRVIRELLQGAQYPGTVATGVWAKMVGYITFPWRNEYGQAETLYGRYPAKELPAGDDRAKTLALPGEGSKASPLYFDRVRNAHGTEVVMVEGLMDAALGRARGDSRIVAYVAGAPALAQHRTMARCGITSATICSDPDSGGEAGILSFLKNADPVVRTYVAPKLLDGLDPDEFMLRDGIEGWRAHIARAERGVTWRAKLILSKQDLQSAKGRDDGLVELVDYAGARGARDIDDIVSIAAEPLGVQPDTLRRSLSADTKQPPAPLSADPDPVEKIVGSMRLNGQVHTTYADGRVVTTTVEPPPPNGSAHHEEPQGEGPHVEAPQSEPAPAAPIALKQTEMGLSELLVHRHGKDLRYCFPWSCFLTWDGRRYRRDRTGEARRRAKETVRSVYGIAEKTEDDTQRRTLLDWIKPFEKAARVAAILTLAEAEPGIPIVPEDMDADPFLFNVANGTIDLRAGRLKPHDRADALTKLAPVGYDATAQCPTFLAFLQRVLPDADVRAFLRRAVGYSLTGDTSEQCLFFLHGGGANGKSTFLTVLLELLGDYGKQAAPDLLTHKSDDRHPTELADVFGTRVVTSVEVDEGKRMAETLVKQMTGGDRMKARFMRGDFFEWTPTHKLFLAANHRPVIRGTDYAIWRRIHLVPFEVTIPKEERDGKLGEKLRAELPGILNWAIRGCLEWQQHGLGVPEAVQDATAHYRAEQDVLGDFLSERCIRDAQAFVATTALYKVYTSWCEDGGEKPVNKNAFGRGLTERGFVQGRTKSGRLWQGLRLRGADEPFAGDEFGAGDESGRKNPYSSSNSGYEDDNRKEASHTVTDENASPGGDEHHESVVACFGCGGVVDTDDLMCSACSEATS